MVLRRGLRGEIATTSNNIIYPLYSSGRLDPRDHVLIEKGGGGFLAYDIYEDIARDPHAFAVLQKRLMAVVSRDWEVIPASEKRQDKKVADFVTETLQQLGTGTPVIDRKETCINTGGNFDQMCFELLSATLYGFAVSEILWDQRSGKIIPEHVIAKDIRRFCFTVAEKGGYNLRLVTWDNSHEGMPLFYGKFIVHRYNALGLHDDPYGLGLGARLFFPRWFKSNAVKSWLIFADKLGMPTAVGKYPRTASTDEKEALLDMLDSIATDSGIVIPETMQVEFMEAQRSSTVATYEGLVDFCNNEISKVVLGETGTTDQQGSGGSRARDQVGNDIRIEIAKGDADLLSSTLNNTLIRWLVEYNFPAGTKVPSVVRLFPELEEKEDLGSRAQRDATIVQMSERKLTEKYLVETYGVEFEEEKQDGLDALFGGGGDAATPAAPQAETPAPEEPAQPTEEPTPPEEPAQPVEEPAPVDLAELEAAEAVLAELRAGLPIELIPAPVELEEPPDEELLAAQSILERMQSGDIQNFDEVELIPEDPELVAARAVLERMLAGDIQKFEEVEYLEDPELEWAEKVLGQMLAGDIQNFDEVELIPAELCFEERIEQYLEFEDFDDVLEFAAAKKSRKKPNCSSASQLCVGKDGGSGACVPKTKQCASRPSGVEKAAADYTANHLHSSATMVKPATAPARPSAPQAPPPKTAATASKPVATAAAPKAPPAPKTHQEFIGRGKAFAGGKNPVLDDAAAVTRKLNEKYGQTKKDLDAAIGTPREASLRARLGWLQGHLNESMDEYTTLWDKTYGQSRQKLLDRMQPNSVRAGLSTVNFGGIPDVEQRKRVISEMVEFMKITNGKGTASMKQIKQDGGRAFANRKGEVNIGGRFDKKPQDLWHEAGHHIEIGSDTVRAAAQSWVRSRATGEEKPLNELMPEAKGAFRPDERALPDTFLHPYVGKIYKGGDTEVLSMGMEHFHTSRTMAELYLRDPEHFFFTLGVVTNL